MGCIKQLEMVLIPIYGYLYEGEIPRTEAILGASLLVVTLLLHSVFQWLDEKGKRKQKAGHVTAESLPGSEENHGGVDIEL